MTPPLSNTERRTDDRARTEQVFHRNVERKTFEHTEPDSDSGVQLTREATVCVVGLGYVGLPLAVGFGEAAFDVIGFDVDDDKVETLQDGVDTTGDLSDKQIAESGVTYTADPTPIQDADYVFIAVPTPINRDGHPDLDYVESAAHTVGSNMAAGTTIVLESTVYPGATRDVLVPALEESSGFSAGEDFFVGYSPERATPGDEEHGLADVVKVVSGQNEAVLNDVAALYESIVDAGVHRAPSIEVAEASKVVENTQRDINIAFVNELTMALEEMEVDTHAVLEAAGTKWNFHDYRPGLVGGHCIPVDPNFLAYQAERSGYTPELIQAGREVNESVPAHLAEITIKALNRCHKTLCNSRVLVLGLAYKPNVDDIRSSKVSNVIAQLEDYDVDVEGYDPHADNEMAREAFGIEMQDQLSYEGFDAVMVATPHDEFAALDLESIAADLAEQPALIDVTGAVDEAAAARAGFVYRRL
ncbi:nucleotide sugar dehydrogenase [Natrialbaceae archaeon A-CW3]